MPHVYKASGESKGFSVERKLQVPGKCRKKTPFFRATGLLVLRVKLMEINVATAVFQVGTSDKGKKSRQRCFVDEWFWYTKRPLGRQFFSHVGCF